MDARNPDWTSAPFLPHDLMARPERAPARPFEAMDEHSKRHGDG
jgi:hypothetical protein